MTIGVRHIILLVMLSIGATGCSVGMAARTGGVKLQDVQSCQTRQCFLEQDKVEILEASATQEGGSMETYKFQLKRGSAGRAAMHGLLDVATLGVWEIAGTPIEATKKRKYVVITAVYDAEGVLKTTVLGDQSSLLGVIDKVEPVNAPEGSTPVYANDTLVGYMMPDGSLLKVEQIAADTLTGS